MNINKYLYICIDIILLTYKYIKVMLDRKELKKKLPRGYCKEVAKLAHVTPQSVSLYFSYTINSYIIERAVLDVLAKLEKQRTEMLNKIG